MQVAHNPETWDKKFVVKNIRSGNQQTEQTIISWIEMNTKTVQFAARVYAVGIFSFFSLHRKVER